MPTLEERVTRLEKRMDDEARLRALMDRDMADIGEKLRIQIELIQALADTQSQHTAVLTRHTAILEDHGERLERLEGAVGGLDRGVQQIITKLDTLISRESPN